MAKRKRGVKTVPVGRGTVKARARHPAKRPAKSGPRTVTLSRPPVGSYDPNLDVQERAAKRGYGYTTEDLAKGSERDATDFGLSQAELERQKADVGRQYGENLSDLLKARTRGSEDYGTNLQTIARNFQQLGNQQAQRGRQAGLEGGFAVQSARKRAANQAIARAPVDTAFKRFSADSSLDQTRLGQARQRSIDSIDRSGGQLDLTYGRGQEDSAVTGERAGTELQNYLQDIAAARQDQYRGPLPTVNLPAPKDPYAGVKAGLRNTRIGRKRKQPSFAQWKRGDVLSALVGKSRARQMTGRI
jgi:hypothetical protein